MEAAEGEPRRENLQRQERMEWFEALIQRRAKQAAETLGLEHLTQPSEEDQVSITCHYCGHLLIKSRPSQH